MLVTWILFLLTSTDYTVGIMFPIIVHILIPGNWEYDFAKDVMKFTDHKL